MLGLFRKALRFEWESRKVLVSVLLLQSTWTTSAVLQENRWSTNLRSPFMTYSSPFLSSYFCCTLNPCLSSAPTVYILFLANLLIPPLLRIHPTQINLPGFLFLSTSVSLNDLPLLIHNKSNHFQSIFPISCFHYSSKGSTHLQSSHFMVILNTLSGPTTPKQPNASIVLVYS